MNKYIFKPYNEVFIKLFDIEKNRIKNAVNEPIIIEHIGSTAINGLGGKGIIDIAVGCNIDSLQMISQKLQNIGYEYRPSASTSERLFHKIDLADSLEQLRRYHLHLTYLDSRDWQEMIKFRDYLRTHEDERNKYASIKKRAASIVYEDGQQYRRLKEPVIQEIVKKAFSE